MSKHRYAFESLLEERQAAAMRGYDASQYQGGMDMTHPFDYLAKVNMGGEKGALSLPTDGPFATQLDVGPTPTPQPHDMPPKSYVPHLAIGLLVLFYLFV